MSVNLSTTRTYNGKKLVITVLAGFVVFTVVGLLLTFLLARAMTPYYKHRFETEHPNLAHTGR